MVWMLARSEASPASQPGPVAHKSHKHRWSGEVDRGRGRATWRHSDGARLTRKCHQPSTAGGEASSPRGTRPARVSVARTDREWPRLRGGVTRARPSLTNCRICPPFCPSKNNVSSDRKPRPAETLEPALPPQLFTSSHLQHSLDTHHSHSGLQFYH